MVLAVSQIEVRAIGVAILFAVLLFVATVPGPRRPK